ncbi:adenosylcobinamide-GDP ribazoletransferase [Chloroflexota bacterium]
MSIFLATLRFLTIISVPWRRDTQKAQLGHSVGYFPVVGLIIGLILVSLNWLFRLVLPLSITNALLLAVLVILTGALHLDGLADTCDGLAGHKAVEDRWRIMRDSRVGGFGVVAIVLILLIKYVSLNGIPGTLLIVSLVLMPVVGRWAMTCAIFAYPYARPSGLGKVFKEGTRWPEFIVATIITIIVATLSMKLIGLVILAIVSIIIMVLATYFKRTFAGLTGDNYGAINEISEASVLILINIFVYSGLLQSGG